jgi:hypothetical protein
MLGLNMDHSASADRDWAARSSIPMLVNVTKLALAIERRRAAVLGGCRYTRSLDELSSGNVLSGDRSMW